MSHPDLDQLLNILLPRAQELLGKYGEFYPFAAGITANGKVELVAGYTGCEHPPSVEVIEVLVEGLQDCAQKGEYRATGICFDVRVQPPTGGEKTDAVCVSLERGEGEAVNVYLPYQKRFLRRMAYGELFATAGTPQMFVPKS